VAVQHEKGPEFFSVDGRLCFPGPAAIYGGKHGRGSVLDVVTDGPASLGVRKPDRPQQDFNSVHLMFPGPAAVTGVQKDSEIELFQSGHFTPVAGNPTMVLIDEMDRQQTGFVVTRQSLDISRDLDFFPGHAAILGAVDGPEFSDHPTPVQIQELQGVSGHFLVLVDTAPAIASVPGVEHALAADDPSVPIIDKIDVHVLRVNRTHGRHPPPGFASVFGPENRTRFRGNHSMLKISEINGVHVDGHRAGPFGNHAGSVLPGCSSVAGASDDASRNIDPDRTDHPSVLGIEEKDVPEFRVRAEFNRFP